MNKRHFTFNTGMVKRAGGGRGGRGDHEAGDQEAKVEQGWGLELGGWAGLAMQCRLGRMAAKQLLCTQHAASRLQCHFKTAQNQKRLPGDHDADHSDASRIAMCHSATCRSCS